MILFRLILLSHSAMFCQTISHFEETAECARNSQQVEARVSNFFVGCHSFKELITRNHVFIDKSLLLREIFEEYFYLTIFYLPPKFSKTTNLEMIRFFTEFQLNSNDSIVPYKHTISYNFFALGKIFNEKGIIEGQLKNPPMISRHIELIDQHVAQQPAIYFDFSMVRCVDFACSWASFRDNIGREFRRYKFLTSRISFNESSQYKQLFDYFNRTEWTLDSDFDIDLPSTVIFLAKMASKFFQKKPILYIDEYDSLLGMFIHKHYYNEKESEQVLTFFSQFVDAVFTRDDIWHRIILTGTHGIHSNIISLLEGSKAIYYAFDNNLSHFFGFTEADVTTMSKHYPRVSVEEVQQMREYYNGYQMDQFHPIYSPWCIMNFFTTQELINHWEEQSEYKWFLYNLWGINQMRYLWLDLLSDRANYLSRPFEKFSHDDLWTLRNTLDTSTDAESHNSFSLNSKEFTQVLMYQVDIGYLTWANYDIPDRDTTFNIRVANLEIKKAVYDDMRSSYKMYLNLNVPLADNATAALHSYLFSRQREKTFNILTRSFDKLFKQAKEMTELNASTIELQADPIGRHIIEYIGLTLRYQYNHKLDRNIADGFISSKLNVSCMVIFNYNKSIKNEHILNQIDNFTHPWTRLDPEATNSSVTYVVIGVTNKTTISIRRYGAEPPIQPTTTTVSMSKDKKKYGKISKSSKNMLAEAKRRAKKKEKEGGGGSRFKVSLITRVGQSSKHKGLRFTNQVTKDLNTSFMKGTMVMTKSGKIFRDNTVGFGSSHGSQSIPQFKSNVSAFLNELGTVEKMITEADELSKNIKIYTHDLAKNNFEKNFTTTGFTESNPTNTIISNSSRQSLMTESSPNGSKSDSLITKTLQDYLRNESKVAQVNNESGLYEPRGDHIDITDSIESKSTNTIITGLFQLSSTIYTSDGSKLGSEFTFSMTESSNSSIVDETSTTSTSKFISTVTKSPNVSFINETTIRQVDIDAKKSTDINAYHSAKSTQSYAENTSFNSFGFPESNLKEITRVIRSVPDEQSPSTSITPGKSKSGLKSNLQITKSLRESFETNTKINDFDTTLFLSDFTKITLFTSSTDKKLKAESNFNPKVMKNSNKSLTNDMKVTDSNAAANTEPFKVTTVPIIQSSSLNVNTTAAAANTEPFKATTVPKMQSSSLNVNTTVFIKDAPQSSPSNVFTTTSIKDGPQSTSSNVYITVSIKDAPTFKTQPNPSNHCNVTLLQQSTSGIFSTKSLKSGSKFNINTKLKVTRPHNSSKFTKRKKGKNFNVTAFVRGNFSKFTKFSKGQKSLVNKTTITTTPSTTTEPTTTEMTFFPPPRPTAVSYVRRSRTGLKIPPKTTTISAMQFWKSLLHVH